MPPPARHPRSSQAAGPAGTKVVGIGRASASAVSSIGAYPAGDAAHQRLPSAPSPHGSIPPHPPQHACRLQHERIRIAAAWREAADSQLRRRPHALTPATMQPGSMCSRRRTWHAQADGFMQSAVSQPAKACLGRYTNSDPRTVRRDPNGIVRMTRAPPPERAPEAAARQPGLL